MTHEREIIIIGGGAAGLTAAVAGARRGARVRVLERMSRVGRKLLATGNGRCNLTNRNRDLSHYHGTNPGFVRPALGRFGVAEVLSFFEDLGIATREEEGGKIFPFSGQASSVLDVLRYEIERLGVEELGDHRVQTVTQEDGRFVCFCTNGARYAADK
ncbi:NAD(P)/FAD-dependent oxidoreductase, partial [bacterium]|nr:NAD(P)/FAD-dependent oxidoreductase [bacterium]